MEFVKLTRENIEREHICCAISSNKDIQVMSKKNWLKERLDEGLVFLKGDVRGKCFIEYLPAEYAWTPIEAEGCMYIDCLWVSGKFKGHGYSNMLLERCIEDSREKGRTGLVILSSKKKRGFLSEPGYMKYKGFETVDTAQPYFELMYLPFDGSADKPRFRNTALSCANLPKGYVIYYTDQCPFTAKYVPLLENMAKARGAVFKAVHIKSREEARNAPTPFPTFSLFYDGQFLTHEILSEKKFEKILISKEKSL